MTDQRPDRQLARFTATIYWSCILFGLTIPALATIAVDVLKHGQSLGQAVHQWRMHLFAPGYNLFLVATLNAIPFLLLAVFSLLHLGWAGSGPSGLIRRKAGVLAASLAAIGLSLWTHVLTLWYPDAQGALAYLFLPMALLLVIPSAYAAGWAGTWAFQKIRPTGTDRPTGTSAGQQTGQ